MRFQIIKWRGRIHYLLDCYETRAEAERKVAQLMLKPNPAIRYEIAEIERQPRASPAPTAAAPSNKQAVGSAGAAAVKGQPIPRSGSFRMSAAAAPAGSDVQARKRNYPQLAGDRINSNRARATLQFYLNNNGIQREFDIAPVIVIHNPMHWRKEAAIVDPGNSEAYYTVLEGVTPAFIHRTPSRWNPRPALEYAILINGDHHTWGTMLHEMFHSLANDDAESWMSGSKKDLAEGLTEFLTCEAMGWQKRMSLVARHTKAHYDHDGTTLVWGDSPAYERQLQMVREGLSEGAYAVPDIFAAYFHGDSKALRKIDTDFFRRWNQDGSASSVANSAAKRMAFPSSG